MNELSVFIPILFGVTTGLTVWQFYNASGKSKVVLGCLSVWLLFQAIIGLTGFYQVPQGFPPRFVLLIGPGLLFSVMLFLTEKGRRFLDSLNIRMLTILHAIRIPVEITLYYVFVAKLIPELMTFEGYNYDILSGLTAPLIYYLVFESKKLGSRGLLIWNFICLGLLINILVIAILSAQTPFQRLAFDQPNIGITFFPFVWLPSVVVPIVLIAHLAAIRQLIVKK
jgi:hypothetical protein